MYINDEHPRILLDQIRDDSLFKLNQIPGEIRGVINAVKYAINTGYKKVTIYHDYKKHKRKHAPLGRDEFYLVYQDTKVKIN